MKNVLFLISLNQCAKHILPDSWGVVLHNSILKCLNNSLIVLELTITISVCNSALKVFHFLNKSASDFPLQMETPN